ncbi:Galactosylgalactosylxylosylprotein 3-beta-glucuronosyltransferase S [Orchesella cincta]|uniref:galactosylgalactosylxylosylprotein 3-beta-glucuronosyltransferase n=1 Tax=Orchesella cincta TaxID=48709 RepID=A0A1D2MRZ0_ORCCI|nr:Galactosylgalactosylxylosylprotein 3-beta-glucuronosyltransferase S [Orchesella cincta]
MCVSLSGMCDIWRCACLKIITAIRFPGVLLERKPAQDDDDEISPPLLVRIQTIDLQNLDFQTNVGSTAKFRHLTYIEATNLFLFVGSTSGSVYVFSRDALKFLFIIPFKGGKVCNIACSQDESDIAVASIRGQVSIYRISPNVHYMQSSTSCPLIDAFRHIYDIPHHSAEITEQQWSPNGKYLFIGDSNGLITQMDVACLDEFPRPVPSKIILKLQTRVLQIECSFPYLAICTLTAVFLCDLEKEDFTRIQHKKNTDIRSTGICLMILPERSSLRDLYKERMIPSAKLMLFIGEVGCGTVHCCGMEGNIQQSKKIMLSNKVNKYSTPMFDPTKSTVTTSQIEEEEDQVNISLGKMLCTDDGMIVSVSNNRLFVYDPYTLNVIVWNEEFNRINNFKIISNYAFIWAGNKLEVVAFTPFRTYGEQLFRAKLIGVLDNWIVHTVYSLGWRVTSSPPNGDCDSGISEASGPKPDDTLEKAEWNFRKMMFSEGEEENEFTQYVIKQLPFPLEIAKSDDVVEPVPEAEVSSIIMEECRKLDKNVRSFLARVTAAFESASIVPPGVLASSSSDNHSNSDNRISSALSLVGKKQFSGQNEHFHLFCQIYKGLLRFYEDNDVTLPQLDYKSSDLTLQHVLNSAQSFLIQPKLVNLIQEISEISEISRFEDIIIQLIVCLYAQQKSATDTLELSKTNSLPFVCFTKFTQCPVVIQWFRELGISPANLFYDGVLADTLLLLLPLCPKNDDDLMLLSSSLESIGAYEHLPKYFITWLFLCRFLHKPKQVPYSPLLRSLLIEQLFDKLAEEMFSSGIYRDFRLSTFGNAAQYLHHFVSVVVLLSKSPDCSQPRNVSILLTCFPLNKWAREDIVTKIIAACHLNPSLIGLYLKACLEDGHSMKLCACGIQSGYGSLEDRIPSWQRAIEEAIIKLLLEEYFKSSPYEEDAEEEEEQQDGNGNTTQKRRTEMLIHMFAMKRGVLEPFFRTIADEFLSEEMQAELIVRSGNCASLKYFPCNQQNMSLILRCFQNHFVQPPGGISKISEKSKNLTLNTKQTVWKTQDSDNNNAAPKHAKNGRKNKCFKCSSSLEHFSRNTLSRNCLGLWALKHVGSLERLLEIIQSCHLNVPAMFSARFYQAVVKFHDGAHKGGLTHEYDLDSMGESSLLSCSNFHENKKLKSQKVLFSFTRILHNTQESGMLIMLTPKVRRLLTNKYIGEIIGPFVIGFSTVLILSWIHQTLIALTSDTPRRNATLPETFTDKNGQVYLKRHGMQTEEDIYRLKTDKKYYGIRADAGNGFRRIIVDSSKDSLPSPPGEVWSWPRIEEEADPNKLVWVVTPTYRNPFQYAELTRVAQALYPARKFVRWLVCDDHTKSSGHPTHIKDLRRLLLQFNIKFTLITSTARPKKERIMFNPKGVEGRRVALEFIRRRKLQGTVYFADDDNTYDSDIFRQIQDTKTVSTWPTGLITDWAVSSPIVNAEGTVVDFFDSFRSRKFPVDFASFAINCSLLHANKKANIPWVQGYEETYYFFRKLGHPLDFNHWLQMQLEAKHYISYSIKE